MNAFICSWVAVLLAGGTVLSRPAVAQETPDDRFLAALNAGADDEPVDRRRLAQLFANVAATLEVEKGRVETLLQLVRVPEPAREDVARSLARRFEDYASLVSDFRAHASELVDEPNSRLLFYQVTMDGQRTCWTLDLYRQLVGSRASSGDGLQTIQPSREACARFRTAAFQPRVEAIIGDALIEQVYQREEIRRLKAELEDLQRLLDDLVEIDSVEPQAGP